jgi:hypothetical protein
MRNLEIDEGFSRNLWEPILYLSFALLPLRYFSRNLITIFSLYAYWKKMPQFPMKDVQYQDDSNRNSNLAIPWQTPYYLYQSFRQKLRILRPLSSIHQILLKPRKAHIETAGMWAKGSLWAYNSFSRRSPWHFSGSHTSKPLRTIKTMHRTPSLMPYLAISDTNKSKIHLQLDGEDRLLPVWPPPQHQAFYVLRVVGQLNL